jgi:hypothetical protein
MEKKTPRELILKTLKEKSSMKQDVYANTVEIPLIKGWLLNLRKKVNLSLN